MAPNKKKKKAAPNAARGFATSSIPSKPKQEKADEAEAKLPQKDGAPASETVPQASEQPPHSAGKVAQTPDDYEAQLEHDELQLLVEKHAPKTRREARRQVTKCQTDSRVLRPQAQSLSIQDWLPTAVMDEIMSLAQVESDRKQGQQSLLKVLAEEDALSKLWTLSIVLGELGYTDDNITPVLKWLCANAAAVDNTPDLWGFQESLEWLALNQPGEHMLSYDEPKPKRLETSPSVSEADMDSHHGELISTSVRNTPASGNSTPSMLSNPTEIASIVSALGRSGHDDANISDLDSDLEPDQLVPAYLKLKEKVYELDPDASEIRPRKNQKGRNVKASSMIQSPALKKLLSQLQQLESDALFDKNEAEGQWRFRRTILAQTMGQQRKTEAASDIQDPPNCPEISVDGVEETSPATLDPAFIDDEADMLGGMFTAVPEESTLIETTQEPPSSTTVTIRDFGKQSGMSPKRLLEEAVHARDHGARLLYEIISDTVYSCRSSLVIAWSKAQDIACERDVPGVSTSRLRSLKATFAATSVATVSVEQSDNYISTAAMFSLFCSSPREDKIYLRLSPNWRDLYKEFLDHQQDTIDAADRDQIKFLRTLIQNQVDDDESGGVVLTNRFKMRNQASVANSVASNSGRNTPLQSTELEFLKEIWKKKCSASTYQRMFLIRTALPVFNFRQSILSTIDQNQVTIICGETGCGKSTQIPAFILEHELSQGKQCKVFCTEPRRISAISLAQRVSEELGEASNDLGTPRSLVGYAIRLESKTSAHTRLVYATVGVVLRMLEGSKNLQEVTHLIIDEVHERNIDTDFLLIVLRSLMFSRPDLKVILMSATVDSQRFSTYLNGAPVLNVPGRTFPVDTKYLEDAIECTNYTTVGETPDGPNSSGDDDEEVGKEKSGIPSKLPGYSSATRNVLSNYDEYAIDYELVVRLIETVAFDQRYTRFSNAFLVFMPGIAEIRQLNDMLLGHPSFNKGWLVYPLHSTISSEEQQAAFLIPPPGIRKIVIATNIAETGVTIPDVTCVIDTGKHREMRFDERRQLSRLTQSFISRANAKQRRGRAGRVQDGLCFHLFTKYRHDTLMADSQTPEMLRLSLQDLVMRTKICKLGEIEKTLSEALDPPSSRNIRRAIDALIEVDALTTGEELTSLGRQLAKLPLDAHLGKLVLLASQYGCVDVAITIAAILSSKSPFLTPFGARQRADAARLIFKKGDSDLLTAYNAYKSWKTTCLTPGRSEVQFCHKNFLSAQNLGNIEDLKAQLLSSLADAGCVQLSTEEHRALRRYRSTFRHRSFVAVPSAFDRNSDNDVLVNAVIAAALYPKIILRDGKGWRNISNNQTVSLAPTSVNKPTSINTSTAKFLSYYHIMQSSSKFYNAHSTSIVQPLPLVLMLGAEIDFKLHAGVISLQGNTLRFSVNTSKVCVALKVMRRRIREILSVSLKNPGRTLGERETEWMGLFFRIFTDKWEREERLRERSGKGK